MKREEEWGLVSQAVEDYKSKRLTAVQAIDVITLIINIIPTNDEAIAWFVRNIEGDA